MSSQVIEFFPHHTHNTTLPDLLSDASFEAHVKQFDHLPWLQTIKSNAWEQFKNIPMPKRTDEAWRFSGVNSINLDNFHLSQAPCEHEQANILKASNLTEPFAGRLVFEDNHLVSHDYISDKLQEAGVIWEPLSQAFEKYPELLQEYLSQPPTTLGADKFYYLNIAYAHTGSFLFIPKNITINDPLIAYHWENAPHTALFPQTIAIIEENAHAKLIDIYTHHSQNSQGLSIAATNIHIHPNATFHRTSLQNWNAKTTAFSSDSLNLDTNATLNTTTIHLGSQFARAETKLHIHGEHANANISALTVSKDKQEFDQRTYQAHHAGNATSNLLFKNALTDSSKTTFSGMIRVDEGAQQTDAYQTNRNLLLSPTVEANSLPGLEIEANDVKCSHGATSGRLDESELFYMTSRGITPQKARELLTFGFMQEILDTIPHQSLLPYLHSLIENKFKD